MRNKPIFWILKHKDDDRFLCTDGKRRHMVCCASRVKTYRYGGNAMRRAGFDYVCHAVYEGESVNCCGQIEKN